MAPRRSRIIERAAQMWPRSVFDFDGWETVKDSLKEPGVYVLFRDDLPYYVGKTKGKLFHRIRTHAVKTKGRYYHFWNYFSVFAVPNSKHRDEIEGVLIASMPLANGATPKIRRIPLPRNVAKLMKGIRQRAAAVDE